MWRLRWRWWRRRTVKVGPPEWPGWATEQAQVWPAVDPQRYVERECEG